jgi:hypothetical protein
MISNCDGAVFVFGVEFVGKGLGEGIVEDRDGFTEGDAVLFEVGGGFGWVELEAHISHAR